eukprot:RCo032872
MAHFIPEMSKQESFSTKRAVHSTQSFYADSQKKKPHLGKAPQTVEVQMMLFGNFSRPLTFEVNRAICWPPNSSARASYHYVGSPVAPCNDHFPFQVPEPPTSHSSALSGPGRNSRFTEVRALY